MNSWNIENYTNYDKVIKILREKIHYNIIYYPDVLKDYVSSAIKEADSNLSVEDYRKIVGKMYFLFSMKIDSKWYIKLIALRKKQS